MGSPLVLKSQLAVDVAAALASLWRPAQVQHTLMLPDLPAGFAPVCGRQDGGPGLCSVRVSAPDDPPTLSCYSRTTSATFSAISATL